MPQSKIISVMLNRTSRYYSAFIGEYFPFYIFQILPKEGLYKKCSHKLHNKGIYSIRTLTELILPTTNYPYYCMMNFVIEEEVVVERGVFKLLYVVKC